MSRELKAWARDSEVRRGPRCTLLRDAIDVWRTSTPRLVPTPGRRPRPERLGWSQLQSVGPLIARLPRFELEVVGRDALLGIQTPLVFAVNEAGALDQRILRLALPRVLRPASHSLSRSLSRGRPVVVFSDEPRGGRLVGEFQTIAAELATQHSVAIVPVGIVGSYRLADTLQLRLNTRPKVSVRFGAPVHARGQAIGQITQEVQVRVESLVGEGDLSWWEIEQRRTGARMAQPTPTARWRRLWEQAAPRERSKHRRIWG